MSCESSNKNITYYFAQKKKLRYFASASISSSGIFISYQASMEEICNLAMVLKFK